MLLVSVSNMVSAAGVNMSRVCCAQNPNVVSGHMICLSIADYIDYLDQMGLLCAGVSVHVLEPKGTRLCEFLL